MEVVRQRSWTAADSQAAIDRIERWPKLSAAAKRTLLQLWRLNENRPGRVETALRDLAADRGVYPSTISRSIQDVLVPRGLVVVMSQGRDQLEVRLVDVLTLELPSSKPTLGLVADPGGQRTLLPADPVESANVRASLRATSGDEEPPDESCAQVCAQTPVSESANVRASLRADSNAPTVEEFVARLNSQQARILREKEVRATQNGSRDRHASCDASAGARENLTLPYLTFNSSLSSSPNARAKPEPNLSARADGSLERLEVSKIVEALGKVSDPEWIAAQNERLIAWLETTFDGLQRSVSRRIAEVVTGGLIPESKFIDAAHQAATAKIPRAYFIGAAQKIFQQHGRPWHETIEPG